jgi:hypothetical protein
MGASQEDTQPPAVHQCAPHSICLARRGVRNPAHRGDVRSAGQPLELPQALVGRLLVVTTAQETLPLPLPSAVIDKGSVLAS